MRSDHTYKCCKYLGVWDGTNWIRLRASLLVVMNEKNQVLNFQIVPNDKGILIQEAYQKILSLDGKQTESFPVNISTDNAKKDGPGLIAMMEEYFPHIKNCKISQVRKYYLITHYLHTATGSLACN